MSMGVPIKLKTKQSYRHVDSAANIVLNEIAIPITVLINVKDHVKKDKNTPPHFYTVLVTELNMIKGEFNL